MFGLSIFKYNNVAVYKTCCKTTSNYSFLNTIVKKMCRFSINLQNRCSSTLTLERKWTLI